jgi:hypothetical protein
MPFEKVKYLQHAAKNAVGFVQVRPPFCTPVEALFTSLSPVIPSANSIHQNKVSVY